MIGDPLWCRLSPCLAGGPRWPRSGARVPGLAGAARGLRQPRAASPGRCGSSSSASSGNTCPARSGRADANCCRLGKAYQVLGRSSAAAVLITMFITLGTGLAADRGGGCRCSAARRGTTTGGRCSPSRSRPWCCCRRCSTASWRWPCGWPAADCMPKPLSARESVWRCSGRSRPGYGAHLWALLDFGAGGLT